MERIKTYTIFGVKIHISKRLGVRRPYFSYSRWDDAELESGSYHYLFTPSYLFSWHTKG